jgi:hypothetical protein
MARTRALLVLLLVGCGGRDPLVGVGEDTQPPPVIGAGGGGGNTTPDRLDGSANTIPPSTKPDAGLIAVPPVPPDAATPIMPPPIMPPPGPPRDAGALPRDAARACAFPDCIIKLMSQCLTEGACTQQRTGANNATTNACYANGVRLIATPTGNGRGQNVNVRVFSPDGRLCYSFEPQMSRGGGVNAALYRDYLGNVVAAASNDRGYLAIICNGQMNPTVVEATCQPGTPNSISGCSSGMCN